MEEMRTELTVAISRATGGWQVVERAPFSLAADSKVTNGPPDEPLDLFGKEVYEAARGALEKWPTTSDLPRDAQSPRRVAQRQPIRLGPLAAILEEARDPEAGPFEELEAGVAAGIRRDTPR